MVLTQRQKDILERIRMNPGCTRAEAIDSYYTNNGRYSVGHAYARVKRLERRGLIVDRGRMNRASLFIRQSSES